MGFDGFFRDFVADARDWCRGRAWILRLSVLVYLAYALVRHWADWRYEDLLGILNFGIHELGHFVFAPFGSFLHTAGGTILEVAVPMLGIWMFYRQRDYFAVAFGFGWLSTDLFRVATYCGDARSMVLPLAAPGVGIMPNGTEDMHDWHKMLSSMNLLTWDHALAFLIRLAASASMAICLVFGFWLLKTMMSKKEG